MKYRIKPQQRRFGVSLTASIAVHVLLAVFIGMTQSEKPLPKKDVPQIMDVVLLDEDKTPAKKAPEKAKTISNRDAVGGSKQAEDTVTRHARAPVSGEQRQQPPAPPPPPKTPPPVKQQSSRMLARRGDTPDTQSLREEKPRKDEPKQVVEEQVREVPSLSSLMPSAMALSQLSRDFQRERLMKQKLSREADIPINTRQAKYAPYAQSLVRALEEQWRPGQASYDRYTDDARRSLIKLTIERNGDLGGVEILHPSPIAQINESAVEAIHAAAPFKVLPTSWGLDRVSFYLTFEVVEDRLVFHPM